MSLGSFSYKSFGVFSTVDSSLWIKIFPTLTPGWIWRTASCKMSPEKRKRKGLFSPQTWHFEEEKVPNNSSFGTFLPYFETIHRFNKKNVWGITYVCTERIFDSGPFMYSKIFLKTPLLAHIFFRIRGTAVRLLNFRKNSKLTTFSFENSDLTVFKHFQRSLWL